MPMLMVMVMVIVMGRSLHAHLPLPARRGLSDDILAETGAPGGIRTPDQWLRKPLLYPAELRARMAYFNRYPRLTAAAAHAHTLPELQEKTIGFGLIESP